MAVALDPMVDAVPLTARNREPVDEPAVDDLSLSFSSSLTPSADFFLVNPAALSAVVARCNMLTDEARCFPSRLVFPLAPLLVRSGDMGVPVPDDGGDCKWRERLKGNEPLVVSGGVLRPVGVDVSWERLTGVGGTKVRSGAVGSPPKAIPDADDPRGP